MIFAHKRYLVFTAVFVLFFQSVAFSQTIHRVKKVYDGDTIKLDSGERVRMIGIDTPEVEANPKALKDVKRRNEDISTMLKHGKDAKQFTNELLMGKKVLIETDVEPRDRYGRLLAYVYIKVAETDNFPRLEGHEYVKKSDGWYDFVNATIVKSGYAYPYTFPPNVKYAAHFQQLFTQARRTKIGLWRR